MSDFEANVSYDSIPQTFDMDFGPDATPPPKINKRTKPASPKTTTDSVPNVDRLSFHQFTNYVYHAHKIPEMLLIHQLKDIPMQWALQRYHDVYGRQGIDELQDRELIYANHVEKLEQYMSHSSPEPIMCDCRPLISLFSSLSGT